MDNLNLHLSIREVERRLRRAMITLPVVAGNEVLNFTLDNFRRQGFMGSSFEPWTKRKAIKKDARSGRNLLIDTGRLRRAGRIVRASLGEVVIGYGVPYARAHNDGLRISTVQSVKSYTRRKGSLVRAHTRKVNFIMPRRQFIGNSPYLTAQIRRVAETEILKQL